MMAIRYEAPPSLCDEMGFITGDAHDNGERAVYCELPEGHDGPHVHTYTDETWRFDHDRREIEERVIKFKIEWEIVSERTFTP